ncbi:MAG: hypothetical protein WD602_00605 [Actinomycetota bacterium]
MGKYADRLAKAGRIVRRPDPDDRRAVLMTLTSEGNDVVEDAIKAYLGAADEVVEVLDHNERLQLAELLRKILVRLEGSGAPGPDDAQTPAAASKGPTHVKLRFENAEAVEGEAG